MSIRKLLFWTHLICGVVAGVVILLMSVTGVLLTYQRQITAWYDMHNYEAGPPSVGATRLPLEALVAKAAAMKTGDTPMTVTLRSDPEAPASVALGQRTLFVNAYTGDVLGEGAPGVRAFFRSVTDWHRWLAASNTNRATGRMITGASNLAFFIIVMSGPFLWWPKKLAWAQVRNIAWFKGGLSSKARDFNWHNTIGIWSAIPLFVIVGSGVVMSYPWANNLVYRVAGEQPPVPGGGTGREGRVGGPAGRAGGGPNGRTGRGGAGQIGRGATRSEEAPGASDSERLTIDVLVARAAEQHPAWRTIGVRLPASPRGPVALTLDEGDGGQPQKRGTLTLDPKTGLIVKWESQAGATPGRRARSWLRFAHTGEVYGFLGQTVAGLASLGGAVLVWTGIALAFRRLLNWRLWRRVAVGQAACQSGQRDDAVIAIGVSGVTGMTSQGLNSSGDSE
jgi:uncharacterized iron-regulated membrane protein